MKRKFFITAHGKKELPGLQNLMKQYTEEIELVIVSGDYSDLLEVGIYEDNEGYLILMEELNKKGTFYTLHERREYTKDEIENSRFYVTSIYYPWENDPYKNAETYGTRYSKIKACSKCGFGKEQISELTIDLKKGLKHKIFTIIPEIVVSKAIKDLIEKNDFTGAVFGPVRDFKNREFPDFYQLIVQNILPPMSNQVRFKPPFARCEKCGNLNEIPNSELIYEGNSFNHLCDFNLTQEPLFIANFRSRQLIVSQKVRSTFVKSKIRGIDFEPVSIL